MPSELEARENIDRLPAQVGWRVCDADQANLQRAERLRQFILKQVFSGHFSLGIIPPQELHHA